MTRPPTRSTEGFDEAFADIDGWPASRVLDGLASHQEQAIAAVRRALPGLARAVELAVPRLAAGGRIFYVGAGTSGRLGVQDGAELTPTFSWPRERCVFLIAGGDAAVTRSVEGAEDDREAGRARMLAASPGRDDVVLALAASGTTPFVLAAASAAREAGALVVGIACNAGAPLLGAGDVGVLLDTGPEAISGSTRLKAGTAQKAALNLFSTAAMVGLGRVYRGLMVDMQASNEKLRARSLRILSRLSGRGEDEARVALEAASGDLKRAILVLLDGIDPAEARRRLAAAGGVVRRARGG
ncbi:MAG: N-acetylmuramic acid 6-phosphate etherase [Alphaproteobacteria bacterium]